MKNIDHIRRLSQRQSNTVPSHAIANGTFVDIFLLRGGVPLNKIQRCGAVVLGLFYIFGSSWWLGTTVIPELRTGNLGFLGYFCISAFVFYAGIRITVNA